MSGSNMNMTNQIAFKSKIERNFCGAATKEDADKQMPLVSFIEPASQPMNSILILNKQKLQTFPQPLENCELSWAGETPVLHTAPAKGPWQASTQAAFVSLNTSASALVAFASHFCQLLKTNPSSDTFAVLICQPLLLYPIKLVATSASALVALHWLLTMQMQRGLKRSPDRQSCCLTCQQGLQDILGSQPGSGTGGSGCGCSCSCSCSSAAAAAAAAGRRLKRLQVVRV